MFTSILRVGDSISPSGIFFFALALVLLVTLGALVVGVDRYLDTRIPTLSNAVGDARAVGRLLETQLGYEVVLLENATRPAVVSALSRLSLELGPQDSVVIYYAGHGELVEATRQGYWQLADSRAGFRTSHPPRRRLQALRAHAGAGRRIADQRRAGADLARRPLRATAEIGTAAGW